jgi:SulP family sulfate permease
MPSRPAAPTAAVEVPTLPTVRSALRSPRILTREVLAGLVVALALIPEAISFSIIAGVDPRVGLFSSFVMAVTIAFLGGRPAMISAATGAVALVIAPVARTYGMDYFLATVILAGVFQVLLAVLGVAKLMRFIPRSVMVGFVNSLAILIFTAQLPQLIGVPWAVYPLVAVGIAIIVLLPRITRVVPAPLVAILLITAATVTTALAVPTVGDQGDLPESLPELILPNVPLTWETFTIIAPFSLAMALVGILESLMTAKLVDDITDSRSRKTRETWGQGVANVFSGFLGGVFLLILVVALGDVVAIIPMAALVAVMVMVSVGTFDWHSVRPSTLRRMPLGETIVMVATVVVVVVTHNLAIGVVVGVIAAMVVFARRVAHFATVRRTVSVDDDGREVANYAVDGELFFASSNDLTTQFEYAADPQRVIIDMTRSHVWDASTVAALDAITTKYAQRGKTATIVGMNDASAAMHERLAGNLGAGA